jgi:energy-coupling factor transporter ATP-binding protein EcfA2
MNTLTKLSIKKFRNVVPTTLEFRPGINVLLGKNAAGKTTLLRLLSTAVGVGDAALQDDVFDVSYNASSASFELEHTITKTRVNAPALALDPERPVREGLSSLQRTDSLLFEKNGAVILRAELLPNEVVLERAGQQRRIEQRFSLPQFTSTAFSLLIADGSSPASEKLARNIILTQIQCAGRMDESLDQFNTLLSITGEGSGEIQNWNVNSIPVSMYNLGPIPEGTSATFSLMFLDRAARVLGYESASARFDVERLRSDPSRQTLRLSNPRFFFKRPGEEISHDLLSYGQKRLLAFFAHADASRDLIIADELVNGLHHEWISACLEEIGNRQAFLTSQNPLLLDFLRFDNVDEVRRTFILCERKGAQLVWRNPTEDEAESFFLAYQTGIQRVSDILLTKGLW